MPEDNLPPAPTEPTLTTPTTPATPSSTGHTPPAPEQHDNDAYPGSDPGGGPEPDPVLTAPWNHRGTVEAVVVLRSGGDRMKRRVFLSLTGPALTAPAHQWLIHEPEPLISGLSGQRISTRLITQLAAMITELRKMDDVAGGGSVLDLAQQEFSWVAGLLDHATYTDTTGRQLHKALAELGQLCGWTAYDAGAYGLAQRYNIAGLRAAHTADDRPFGAHILAGMANQAARQESPTEGVTLIDTALSGTKAQATPALLAELHITQALAHATLHDTSSCHAAIAQARAQVEHLAPDDDPPWLYWLDPAAIAATAGACFLQLGQAHQAIVLLNEGIAQFSESFSRDRQSYLARLADARARPGKHRDLDAAADLGMQSIDLAESLDSTRGADRLRDLYYQLMPYTKVTAVQDFMERANTFVQNRNNHRSTQH